MNQRKSVDVSRASQAHHAPQMVLPQSGPVTSTTVVNTRPTSAAVFVRVFAFTPIEAAQGAAQKILYIHASAAFVALYLSRRNARLKREDD